MNNDEMKYRFVYINIIYKIIIIAKTNILLPC